MITVVSGMRRCGTSMMMQALHAGGLGALYSPVLEEVNPDERGYQPNPGGLYEVGFIHYTTPRFLRIMPDGCLVKILWDGLCYLPQGDYKVIFMTRDLQEMEASAQRVDEHIIASGKQSATNHPRTENYPFCCYRTHDQDNVDHVLGICDARKDIELIEVDYGDVIADPVKVFENLRATPLGRVRLPIDVAKSAAVIRPELRRERNVDSQSRRDRLSANG